MEKRKLTKADIDKVRNIDGFPIARDEGIIALSDAQYYASRIYATFCSTQSRATLCSTAFTSPA